MTLERRQGDRDGSGCGRPFVLSRDAVRDFLKAMLFPCFPTFMGGELNTEEARKQELRRIKLLSLQEPRAFLDVNVRASSLGRAKGYLQEKLTTCLRE